MKEQEIILVNRLKAKALRMKSEKAEERRLAKERKKQDGILGNY